MRVLLLPLALMPAACAISAPPSPIAASAPAFMPGAFFSGQTEGRGSLKKMLSSRESVLVHGTGFMRPDGTLILDQTVDEQGKAPKKREWQISQVAPGRYAGTLTDATGPVVGEVTGNRLHLRFKMKGGLTADQWLMLERGARVAQNHMTFRKFGMVVATLDETIRKTS